MAEFEAAITKAIEDQVVTGAACIAVNKSGKTVFSKAFGRIALEADAAPMQLDTTMWIASCTKLLTSICAMQCVEKGLLDLDEPVGKILPEFESPDILTGFDEAKKPILRKATKVLTLRQLLTHSSGFGYTGMNPLLAQYWASLGRKPDTANSSVQYSHRLPLIYEPGEGWEYGSGIDWAGQMVERVNGGISLEEYMKKNIFEPMGMTLTTFRPLKNENVVKRMAGRPARGADGKLYTDTSGAFPIIDPETDSGGAGLYGCAVDYIKVLVSLLRDDGKLLSPETAKQLFTPQLSDPKYIMAVFSNPLAAQFLQYLGPTGPKFNYGLGGCIAVDGIEGRADKGLLFWSGLPNSYWYVDRERGICGVYAGFLLPPGDLPSQKLFGEFHKSMYEESENSKL